MLTKRQLRRLAKEARVLAMLRLAENYDGDTYGTLERRSGLNSVLGGQDVAAIFRATLGFGISEASTIPVPYAGATVFPLLAFADALDDATEGSP